MPHASLANHCLPIIFIMYKWPPTPEQREEPQKPVSDRWQEAADYAELQMDGGDGEAMRSVYDAKGPKQQMPEWAVFRLATQQRAAHHLSAQRGGGDGRRSSLSASSHHITVRSSDLVCVDLESLSNPLSFDPYGNHSIGLVNKGRDRSCVCDKVNTYEQLSQYILIEKIYLEFQY